MAFPDKLLNRDEESILDLRPHWVELVPGAVAVVVTVVAGLVAITMAWPTVVGYLVAAAIIASLIYFALAYATWVTTNFVVTSERVIARKGLLSKQGMEIPLEKINTVFYKQSLFERLIGSGDLGIESAGEDGRQDFSNVRRPLWIQQEIYNQIDLAEDRRLQKMSGHATAPAPSDSIPEQIAQLARLRDQGIISPAEFAEKKAQLLERM